MRTFATLIIWGAVGTGLMGLSSSALADSALTRAVGREILPALSGGEGFDAVAPPSDLAVVLPDGASIELSGVAGGSTGFALTRLGADGALDRSFGVDGVARVKMPAEFGILDLLRAPNGELLVVGQGFGDPTIVQPIIVVALTPSGSVDQSFGTRGVASPRISFGGCICAAVQPDGKLILAGLTGNHTLTSATPVTLHIRGVVIRLTRHGSPDRAFGNAGFAAIVPNQGVTATALVGDAIFAALQPIGGASVEALQSVTASGKRNPAFNAGAPRPLPFDYARSIIGRPGGAVVVCGRVPVTHGTRQLAEEKLAGYSATGRLDRNYGRSGLVALGASIDSVQVLPVGGNKLVVAGVPLTPDGTRETPGLIVHRVTSTGRIDPSLGGRGGLHLSRPAFGGGGSSFVSTPQPQPSVPLEQNTFTGTRLAPRPDGSFLLAGSVAVGEPLGQPVPSPLPGDDIVVSQPMRSGSRAAVAVLTNAFRLDTSFGRDATPLHAGVALASQSAATDLTQHGVPVQLTVSAIGLARVTIRANGQVIADGVVPIFTPGAVATRPVETTAYGEAYLRDRADFPVTVTVVARNLVATQTTGMATGVVLRASPAALQPRRVAGGARRILREGNAGSNTAADHMTVGDQALSQLPACALVGEMVARVDGTGATHAFPQWSATPGSASASARN